MLSLLFYLIINEEKRGGCVSLHWSSIGIDGKSMDRNARRVALNGHTQPAIKSRRKAIIIYVVQTDAFQSFHTYTIRYVACGNMLILCGY